MDYAAQFAAPLMATDERLNIERRAAKTQMPFRVAAVLLGILFVAFGLHQLFAGAADPIAFGFAILIALAGMHFVYSAFAEGGKATYARPRHEAVRQLPTRFLAVEPVSFSIPATKNNSHSESLERSVNPYTPPLALPTTSVVLGTPTQGATLQNLSQQFLDGQPFIHYGVVFFLDASDDSAIHAALPLSSSSDLLVHRNTKEAIRILPEFLSTLPNVGLALSGRNLVVRMISSMTG